MVILPFKGLTQNNQYIIDLVDYGAIYNDNIDDSNALIAALAEAANLQVFDTNGSSELSGVTIKILQGTLNFDRQISVPDINLTIQGSGLETSILQWTAVGGLENLSTDTNRPYGNIQIKNLSILTTVDNNIGLKVQANASATITFLMQNVKIAGINGGYWATCFEGNQLPLTQITDCQFEGDFNNTDKLVTITDFTVASRFLNNTLTGGQIGYYFIGSMEGTFIIDNVISNVDRGIVRLLDTPTGGSEPLFNVINSTITAKSRCMDLRGISSSNISQNLLIVENSANLSTVNGIYMNGTNVERSLTFSENTFINRGNINQTSGFRANDIEGGLIVTNNTFLNFKNGIEILNSNQVLLGDNITTDVGSNTSTLYNLSNLTNLYIKEGETENSLQCTNTSNCVANIKSVNVSGYTNENFIPTNAIDCDQLSEWSVNGIGNYITLELDSPETINNVRISFDEGQTRTYNFEILTSMDGSNFNSKGSFTNQESTESFETFSFTPIIAKYVKIVTNGNSENDLNTIKGLKIITECNSLGLNTPSDIKNIKLTLIPNPLESNELEVAFYGKNNKTEVRIYNLLGLLIFKKQLNTKIGELNNTKLSIPNLENGIYLVRIDKTSKKLIKY